MFVRRAALLWTSTLLLLLAASTAALVGILRRTRVHVGAFLLLAALLSLRTRVRRLVRGRRRLSHTRRRRRGRRRRVSGFVRWRRSRRTGGRFDLRLRRFGDRSGRGLRRRCRLLGRTCRCGGRRYRRSRCRLVRGLFGRRSSLRRRRFCGRGRCRGSCDDGRCFSRLGSLDDLSFSLRRCGDWCFDNSRRSRFVRGFRRCSLDDRSSFRHRRFTNFFARRFGGSSLVRRDNHWLGRFDSDRSRRRRSCCRSRLGRRNRRRSGWRSRRDRRRRTCRRNRRRCRR